MRKALLACLFLAIVTTKVGAQTEISLSKALEEFEKRFPPTSRNAAAEDLVSLAPALGIDISPRDFASDSEDKSEQTAFEQVCFGAWVDAQIKKPDDAIASPPPRLREFLERRRLIVSRAVALLVREVPDWGFDVRQKPSGDSSLPDARLLVSINRILLSAALVEERAGRHGEAGQYLEASWSLSQSLVERPDLLSLIIAVALWKQQAGTVRKMSEPPFQWFERLSNDAPRRQMLSAIEDEPLVTFACSADPSWGDVVERMSVGYRALTDLIRESSACALCKLPREEIRKRILEKFKAENPSEPELDEEEEGIEESSRRERTPAELDRAARVMMEIASSTAIDLALRIERLMVDRELTLKILELRQEREASRTGRWPENLSDSSSEVCPELSYEYHARGAGMLIRFPGYVAGPDASGLVLPLSFEARRPLPTPTPKRPNGTAPKPARVLDSVFRRE